MNHWRGGTSAGSKTWGFLVIAGLVLLAGSAGAYISPPAPDFMANNTRGTAPLAVQFTDQTAGFDPGWVWYFGDETYAQPWTLTNASIGLSPTQSYPAVVLPGGSIVLPGGYSYSNETRKSGDYGRTWVTVNASSGWTKRFEHSAVVLPDSSIVLMGGGEDTFNLVNDTWRSADQGATWARVNASSGWAKRFTHGSVVLQDGSIVLFGGFNNTGPFYYDDVWRSVDRGTTWTRVNASAGWQGRNGACSIVMPDGSIVMAGGSGSGGRMNDTWRSTDKGVTWNRMSASAGWTGRYKHGCVAMPDGSIVLTGGSDWVGTERNDTWRSTDYGATWTRLPDAGWEPRYSHASVLMPNGSIVLIGGQGHFPEDAWQFQPAGSPEQNPVHTYTAPGTYRVALQAYNIGGFNSTRKEGFIRVRGTDKIGVFRPSNHLFYEDFNGNGAWNGALTDRSYTFGITGDIPITGDWNANGTTEIGVFRPSTHLFYLDYNGNGVWNGALTDRSSSFGITGDIPITGDWNNDGKTEIGVFRNSTHTFYLDYNGNGVWNGALTDKSSSFGITGDIPITGDWNNDGKTEIGVYRPSTHLFYQDYNGNGVWNGALTDRSYTFGITGDIPVTSDWNADGTTEIGAFRPSTHLFYEDYNGNGVWNGAITDRSYSFGITGDLPVTGAW